MPELNMNIGEQTDFTPSNPDKKKQEFTPVSVSLLMAANIRP
ncbi:MAG: hypothetical protein WCW25_00475 [Patescibacteria group bacterium]|jgi:hypothetical protein